MEDVLRTINLEVDQGGDLTALPPLRRLVMNRESPVPAWVENGWVGPLHRDVDRGFLHRALLAICRLPLLSLSRACLSSPVHRFARD